MPSTYPDTREGALALLSDTDQLASFVVKKVRKALESGRVTLVADPSVEGVWGLVDAAGHPRAVVYVACGLPDFEWDDDWWIG